MGRAPCCDKSRVNRGPWSPQEDAILRNYLQKHGSARNWIALPHKAGLRRCGKSCRLRWLNYLRPDLKHGGFTLEEDDIIQTLYSKIGSRWSVIASHLPGRTDNSVKNYWNSKLKTKKNNLLAGYSIINTTTTSTSSSDAASIPIASCSTYSSNCDISTNNNFMYFGSSLTNHANHPHEDNSKHCCLGNCTMTMNINHHHHHHHQQQQQQSSVPQEAFADPDPILFPLPGLVEVQEEHGTNPYNLSSHQDILNFSPCFSLENTGYCYDSWSGGEDDDVLLLQNHGFDFSDTTN